MMRRIVDKSNRRGRTTGGMAVALHSHAECQEAANLNESSMLVQSHKHATHRRIPALLAAFVFGSLLLGGCSSGGPHARMSRSEIEDRMEDEFPLGTPRDAVMTRLQRDGATFDAPLPLEQPVGWSSLRVYFDQPWWGPLTWATTYRKTEAWADLLFDQGQSLREVVGEVQERRW
jgi:hypothetical protein